MKVPVSSIAPGKTVLYRGEPCIVLEHREDGTLLMAVEHIEHTFGSSNNSAASSLRAHLNGAYLDALTESHPDEIITRTVDLTALNGSKEYGTVECKVAPLTLDELRKYHGIIPKPEVWEWSATPWSTPKVNEDDTERRTRMGIVLLVEDHTAASVVKAINGLERRFGKLFYKLFKSITVDNGCEFQDFEGIEMSHRRKGKRTIVFFCHPYSAFERGCNENMNRLIRRFFPKGTNFDEVTKEEVMAAERWVNNYPRKILGWKSATMLFDQELQAA